MKGDKKEISGKKKTKKSPSSLGTVRDNHWSPDSQTIKAPAQSETAFLFIHTCRKVLWTMLKLASPAQSAGSILKYFSIFPGSRVKRRKRARRLLRGRQSPNNGILRNWDEKFRRLASFVVASLLSWPILFRYFTSFLVTVQSSWRLWCRISCIDHEAAQGLRYDRL